MIRAGTNTGDFISVRYNSHFGITTIVPNSVQSWQAVPIAVQMGFCLLRGSPQSPKTEQRVFRLTAYFASETFMVIF